MLDRICMTLGGRVSEEIFFGTENITTGAQDDLQKITRMAFEACANYGMNLNIGPVSYGGREGARESWTKPFSEKTAEMLDLEVRKMISCVLMSAVPYYVADICLIAMRTQGPRSY
jgi:AFG3 family protein